jgi:transposase-like protein
MHGVCRERCLFWVTDLILSEGPSEGDSRLRCSSLHVLVFLLHYLLHTQKASHSVTFHILLRAPSQSLFTFATSSYSLSASVQFRCEDCGFHSVSWQGSSLSSFSFSGLSPYQCDPSLVVNNGAWSATVPRGDLILVKMN